MGKRITQYACYDLNGTLRAVVPKDQVVGQLQIYVNGTARYVSNKEAERLKGQLTRDERLRKDIADKFGFR